MPQWAMMLAGQNTVKPSLALATSQVWWYPNNRCGGMATSGVVVGSGINNGCRKVLYNNRAMALGARMPTSSLPARILTSMPSLGS